MLFGTSSIILVVLFPQKKHYNCLKKKRRQFQENLSFPDPDAVWLMQGWLFLDESFWGEDQIRALLSAVGKTWTDKGFQKGVGRF